MITYLKKKHIIIPAIAILAVAGGIITGVILSKNRKNPVGITESKSFEETLEMAAVTSERNDEEITTAAEALTTAADVTTSMEETTVVEALTEPTTASQVVTEPIVEPPAAATEAITTRPTKPTPEPTTAPQAVTESIIETPSATTAAVTEQPTIQNLVRCGGEEYQIDTVTIIGTPLRPDQLVDYTIGTTWMPEGLDDFFISINHTDFIELYRRADNLYGKMYHDTTNLDFGWSGAEIDIPNRGTYHETGYTFESYKSLCFSAFTEEYAKEIFEDERIAEFNGQLWCINTGGIGSDPVDKIDYSVLNRTDSEIEIQKSSYNTYYDVEMGKSIYKFVLTDNGWRISEWQGIARA